jgi:hypothetical protein
MNFYVASTDNRHFFLNTSIIDKNPTLLEDLSSNCINFISKDGQKISVLKNSLLPPEVQNILDSSNQNTFSDITLKLTDIIQIKDLPEGLTKKTNKAAKKKLGVKHFANSAYRVNPGLARVRNINVDDDTPISAANRGDLKKLIEFEEKGQTLSLKKYLEGFDRMELDILKWYYKKDPKIFLKADGIPYLIDEDQIEIWEWCRSIGMSPNEEKLYLAVENRDSGITNILNWANDYNEKFDLKRVAEIAAKRDPEVLRWVLEKFENPPNINALLSIAQQTTSLKRQELIDILKNHKIKKLS